MSPHGRPKGEFPLGGTARSDWGAVMSPHGRPKGEFPLGGPSPDTNSPVDCSCLARGRATGPARPARPARSDWGAVMSPHGRPKGEFPLGGTARSDWGAA